MKKFTLKGNLKKTLKCYTCPSNFIDKSNLNKHIESVHDGKTFKYEIVHQNLQ